MNKHPQRRNAFAASLAAAGAAAISAMLAATPPAYAVAPPMPGPAGGEADPDNWTQYHRTSNAWRYSPLEQINKDNVKRLKAAWIHQPLSLIHI